MNSIKIIPLGGFDQVGLNSIVVEYANEIIIVDMGYGFPDETLPGVNMVLPPINYLLKNKKKIKAIVITHGHIDHIGAIHHLLNKIGNPPIYATNFTSQVISQKLTKENFKGKYKINTVTYNNPVKIGSLKVNFVHVTHSIPDASTITISSPVGEIFLSGDFKFDDTPLNEKKPDYAGLQRIGDRKPIVALIDSTNSFDKGWSLSEKKVYDVLFKEIQKAKGRVIIATFSSEVTRMYSIIDIAFKQKRKVVLLGRSIEEMYKISVKTGYIQSNKNVVISQKQAKIHRDNELIYIVTGTQGEREAALTRMIEKKFDRLSLKKSDNVIMSSSIIPGNEVAIFKNIDKLIQMGVSVTHRKQLDVHATGHAHQQEQLKMLSLVRPKYIIPAYANPMLRDQLRKTVIQNGYRNENVLMVKNGDIWEYNGQNWNNIGNIDNRPYTIDGKSIVSLSNELVNERLQLENNGFIVIVLAGNSIKITHSGIVAPHKSKSFSNEIETIVKNKLSNKADKNITLTIKNAINKYMKDAYDKKPIVEIV
ncbi:MAG TPA: ribonuclease J [Candidatus Dojkabacteria bacterium]|nr:ribonuclease J [Candidatus Dojkabacteria bacterium]HQF36439.1 ribonuclease J [Candidatus Dojkabacteria bacterium]